MIEKCVPLIWKIVCITTIQKKEPSYNASNYRPVLIKSTISKVLSRIIVHQPHEYLAGHNILKLAQFGFQ